MNGERGFLALFGVQGRWDYSADSVEQHAFCAVKTMQLRETVGARQMKDTDSCLKRLMRTPWTRLLLGDDWVPFLLLFAFLIVLRPLLTDLWPLMGLVFAVGVVANICLCCFDGRVGDDSASAIEGEGESPDQHSGKIE